MAKNDPRSQIPAPVVTPATSAALAEFEATRNRYAPETRADEAKPPAPAITELAARAITNGAAMAREYAAAAGELCKTADTHPQGRANARRLLRLALAHLET